MMTETNACAEVYQSARDAEGEAIEPLLSVFWADSFDVDLVESQLVQLIVPMMNSALRIGEAPHLSDEEAIAPLSPVLLRLGTPSESHGATPPQSESPFLDLRDRPSPDILRILAIGSPQVVNNCVMTLYQLGYARPEEWSRQLPTVNAGEVMRILTKRVMLSA